MSFFDGEACPDDNLKGILSIHLKLGKYIHSIKIWKSLDFGIDWSRNGRVINDSLIITNFPNKENTKMLISRKLLDRAISTKFLTRRVSLRSSFPNFQKVFVSPKMAAILNFRNFRKNCKTQKCLYLKKPC